jgi:hypothetical protein
MIGMNMSFKITGLSGAATLTVTLHAQVHRNSCYTFKNITPTSNPLRYHKISFDNFKDQRKRI